MRRAAGDGPTWDFPQAALVAAFCSLLALVFLATRPPLELHGSLLLGMASVPGVLLVALWASEKRVSALRAVLAFLVADLAFVPAVFSVGQLLKTDPPMAVPLLWIAACVAGLWGLLRVLDKVVRCGGVRRARARRAGGVKSRAWETPTEQVHR